jgi:hypothetical protein
MKLYIIKTSNLKTIAFDTLENWKETFAFLTAEGIEFTYRNFSDYSGPSISSDMIYYYHFAPSECSVKAPVWA